MKPYQVTILLGVIALSLLLGALVTGAFEMNITIHKTFGIAAGVAGLIHGGTVLRRQLKNRRPKA